MSGNVPGTRNIAINKAGKKKSALKEFTASMGNRRGKSESSDKFLLLGL